MSNHLIQEPPTGGTKTKWIADDQRLLKLVCNTLTIEVEDNIVYCQIVKELWESIGSLYSKKDNLHQIYYLTLSLLQPDVNGNPLSHIYTDCHHFFQQ